VRRAELHKKEDSALVCPTVFTEIVRKRPKPKVINLRGGTAITKHWYDGYRCDENVTDIGMIVLDLNDDFEFEFIYSRLLGEGIEAMLWTTANHKYD
jgi:hypothetical protein